ncbi:putative RNA binding protein YcfA, dsRBD-like fold, HicA-like mRNA interferase family [Candidatus Fervidibacteria bacterium JGI MDM2 SSWTFF-3-K9]
MRLRSVSKSELRRRLLAIGFEEERGKHHIFFYFHYKGRIVTYTKISHGGGKDIGQPLLSEIMRQLHLSREEFERLLKGDLSHGEYVEILKQRGVVS